MPLYATKVKHQLSINELRKQDADMHLWQEIEVCWSNVDKYDSLKPRTKGLGFHSNLTCNTTELDQSISYQPWGTCVVLSHTMVPRVIGKCTDTRGLGCWAWTSLQGKEQAVAILSAYRPCVNRPHQVYTQFTNNIQEYYLF